MIRKVYTTTPSKAMSLFMYAGVTILELSVFIGLGIISPRQCIAVQSALFKTTAMNQLIYLLDQKFSPLMCQKMLKFDRRQYRHHIKQVSMDHSFRTKNLDINSCKLKKYLFLEVLGYMRRSSLGLGRPLYVNRWTCLNTVVTVRSFGEA